MEVGVDGADFADGDLKAGFLGELAAGRVADALALLDITAGDEPRALVAAGRTATQQEAPSIIKDDHSDAHSRIAEVDETARGTRRTRMATAGSELVVGGEGLSGQDS